MNTSFYNTIYLEISISSFLTDATNSIMFSKCSQRINGSNANINKKNSIMAAFGEYFERENFLVNSGSLIRNPSIEGYSLTKLTPVSIDMNDIITKGIFLDTSGLASHMNSRDCFENAFSEFVERQSFVFNYLSKQSGKYIPNDLVDKFIKIDNFYNEIKFYEISIVPSYFVIIALGKVKGRFYIGLGASNLFTAALAKCVKEINQFRMSYKHPSMDPKEIKSGDSNLDYMDYYLSLSPDKIEKAYNYIDGDLIFSESRIHNIISMKNIIQELHERCNIEPIIVFREQKRKDLNQKIMHIIDLNWFPSINPKTFSIDNYYFVENVMNCTLDQRCNFIPFP